MYIYNKIIGIKIPIGKDLPDKLVKAKFSGIEWTQDGKGFFMVVILKLMMLLEQKLQD